MQKKYFGAGDIFFENAVDALSTAYSAMSSGRWHIVVGYAQAAIEYSFKALTCFHEKMPDKKHDPGEVLSSLLSSRARKMDKDVISWLLWRASSANMVNRMRQYAEYGIPDQGLGPKDLFDREAAKDQMDLAMGIYGDCCMISRKAIVRPVPQTIKVGILDGTVTGARKETRPPSGAYTQYSPAHWKEMLAGLRDNKGKTKYSVEKIPTTSVSPRFRLVINPFGEVYPEVDYEDPSSFRTLLSYVRRGGVLLNAGGLAFWYGFMVGDKIHPKHERQVPMYETRDKVSLVIRVENRLIPVEYVPFYSGLLYKSTGIRVTGGDPVDILGYQLPEDEDICGDVLSNWMGQYTQVKEGEKTKWISPRQPIVREFRSAMSPGRLCPLIPLIRAERIAENGGQEVFPIVAARLGAGFLIHAGIDLSKDFRKRGLKLIVSAVDGFLTKTALAPNPF